MSAIVCTHSLGWVKRITPNVNPPHKSQNRPSNRQLQSRDSRFAGRIPNDFSKLAVPKVSPSVRLRPSWHSHPPAKIRLILTSQNAKESCHTLALRHFQQRSESVGCKVSKSVLLCPKIGVYVFGHFWCIRCHVQNIVRFNGAAQVAAPDALRSKY